MPSGTRIAIFHDDSEVAGNIAAFAAEANLELVHPASPTALEIELYDPLIAAVVLDLVGPRSGGFELLERAANAPSRPQMIVVTELDSKTIESIRRLGNTKGLKLRVFRKGEDAEDLRSFIVKLEKREVRFGAEHLEDAIMRELLHVEYQPKVPLNAADEEFAVEALCRLKHPQFGTVYPDKFIAIAEKHNLIAKLTDFVVCQTFRDATAWHKGGLPVRLAINVSPELLKTHEWCEQFIRRCTEFGMEPKRITLEITESQSGATLDVALGVLARLRLKGFTLSIDDFGTGFSSLAMLYKLPFNELKIDKSFTFDLQRSPEARALVESTIGMALRLGMKVVAEGVETDAVFRELRTMGCEHAQGYFISKSIAAGKVPEFFAYWNSLMKSELLHEANAIPKIAIIQSLLTDLLSEESGGTDMISARAVQGDEEVAWESAKKIPTLVLQGDVVEALARCVTATRLLERHPERVALKGKIQRLRRLLEQELVAKDDLELSTPQSRVRLMPRRDVLIGRLSSGKAVDVPIGCRWLSRGDKNLRLFAKGMEWFIEDLGSTNGSSIGDRILTPGEPYALPPGDTVIEIGKCIGNPAPVAIRLRRPAENSSAVVMSLMADETQLTYPVQASKWPSWREDLCTQWVLFQGRISLGTSTDGALVLPDAGAAKAAEIWFEDGFWIAPCAGGSLSIADSQFSERAPLPADADLVIGKTQLRVMSFKPDPDPASAEVPMLRAKSR
ncbi:MAG TPA: EAL domain-containing protein [Micropepsaceae bacterium]|nr:EAL domain-containing protein [Micropepsaceae bacterium]